MNKLKIVTACVSVLLLIVVGVVLVKFVQGLLFDATASLAKMGETPEPVVEEVWVAPTAGPNAMSDLEAGIDTVVSEDPQSAGNSGYLPDDDDIEEMPVQQTADELTDTDIDDSNVVDQTAEDADEADAADLAG